MTDMFAGLFVNFISSRIESFIAPKKSEPVQHTVIEREIYKPTQVIIPGLTRIACANCKTENKETNEYCTKCGSPLFETCVNCEQKKPRTEEFCWNCGKNPGILRPVKEYVTDLLIKAQQLEKAHETLLMVVVVALLLSMVVIFSNTISWNPILALLWWIFIVASVMTLGIEAYREYVWIIYTGIWAGRSQWNSAVCSDIDSINSIFTKILTWMFFEFLALIFVATGVAFFDKEQVLPDFNSDPIGTVNARKKTVAVKVPILKMWYQPGVLGLALLSLSILTGIFTLINLNVDWESFQQDTPSSIIVSPTMTIVPGECSGSIPASFVVKEEVVVCNTNLSEHPNLRLRSDHSTSAASIDSLPDGTRAIIEGGPVCEEDMYWWQISVQTGLSLVTGWSAQGNEEIGWLCKLP